MGSRSRRKWLASVGLDGETPQQPQQQQPTRKKKDSRSYFPSQNGKPFCVYRPDGLGGTARSANGKTCCVFELQKDGDRVISIHAGDVVIKNP